MKEDIPPIKHRTGQANKAMHVYFEEVARECNNRGVTMKMMLEHLDIEHSAASIKLFWKKIAEAKYGKDSTTKMTAGEIDGVYLEFTKMLAFYDMHISFPSQQHEDNYLESLESVLH